MNKIKMPPYPNFPIVSNNKITLRQIQNPDVIDLIEISYYDAVQAKTLEQAIKMNLKLNLMIGDVPMTRFKKSTKG